MEPSPFLHPGFIVPTTFALIAFIGWLIRLESKVNTNSQTIGRNEVRLEDNIKVVDHHRANSDIHFNLRTAQEAEKRHDERFAAMQRELVEIKTMVKELKDARD